MNDFNVLANLMGRNLSSADLQKALTTGSGFAGINLEPQAKRLLPLYAGLRKRMSVDTPKTGASQAQWKMILGYGAFDFAAAMGSAAGAIGSAADATATPIAADYAFQSIAGSVQLQAIDQAQGFEDPMTAETAFDLSTLVKLDELMTLGGNRAALSAPVPSGAGSTLQSPATFAAGVWTVAVTALSLKGTLANKTSFSNVGESVIGTVAITVASGGATFLDVSWPIVPGAFGYKVYANHAAAGGAGATYYCNPATLLNYTNGALTALGGAINVNSGQTYVGVNRVQIIGIPATSAGNPPATDGTADTQEFEGLMSWCGKQTIYGLDTGTKIKYDCLGQNLTVSAGGIDEFDYILQQLWAQYQCSPSLIITSPAGASIISKQLSAATAMRPYYIDVSGKQGGYIGGMYMGGYQNKFTATMTDGQIVEIPVWAHPYCPDGQFMFLTEQVNFEYGNEGRGFGMDVQRPYTYFRRYAQDSISFPFSLTFSEVLKCYFPPVQCMIGGVKCV